MVRFNLDFSAPWLVNSFFLLSANWFFYAVTVLFIIIFFDCAVTVSIFSELFVYAATVFFLPESILHKQSVEGYSPADWVCLFETRFSWSVEHLRQRLP